MANSLPSPLQTFVKIYINSYILYGVKEACCDLWGCYLPHLWPLPLCFVWQKFERFVEWKTFLLPWDFFSPFGFCILLILYLTDFVRLLWMFNSSDRAHGTVVPPGCSSSFLKSYQSTCYFWPFDHIWLRFITLTR